MTTWHTVRVSRGLRGADHLNVVMSLAGGGGFLLLAAWFALRRRR